MLTLVILSTSLQFFSPDYPAGASLKLQPSQIAAICIILGNAAFKHLSSTVCRVFIPDCISIDTGELQTSSDHYPVNLG